jgi:serine/threonine-protein kinase RsbW
MPSDPPADAHELRGPAAPALLGDVHGLLAGLWAAHPEVGDLDQLLFATALAEVAANVVAHAGGAAEVHLRLSVTDGALRADLEDDGAPAPEHVLEPRPADDLAETGRGIAIAQAALDELAYRREGDRNRWTLVRRTGPGAQDLP